MTLHHAQNTPVTLDGADLHAHVTGGAHGGAYGSNDLKTPTEAQAQAGTYKMGRTTVQGLRIAIEQPQGSIRTGKGTDGKEWSSRMAAHYGYFEGTRGADGDGIDCFVGPFPESETVFVINQRNKGGGFDEHKVMLGFMSERHARGAYLDSYERGWAGLQSMVPMSLPQFRWWLKHGNKLVALTAESLPLEASKPMTTKKIYWTDTQPDGVSYDQVLYELRRMDGPDGLLLDSVTMAEIMEDTDGVIALDALVVENAQLARMSERLRAIMDRSGGQVKAPAVQVSEPFRARGVTNIATVFELSDGQTVSVFFHNPDTAPNKLAPGDEMISWKWLLNKKDITIVVAPEKGQDLNPRTVAQRIMKLAEKNSPAFQKANTKRAERMGNIEAIRGRIAEKEAMLNELVAQVEAARLEKDQRVIAAEDEARKASYLSIEDASDEQLQYAREGLQGLYAGTHLAYFVANPKNPSMVPSGVGYWLRKDNGAKPTELVYGFDEVDGEMVRRAAPGAVEQRDWQKNPEADPADGAEVIEAWDVERADSLLLGIQAGQVDSAPEAIARAYITKHLQGRVVKTKAGDCLINSQSRGKLPRAAGRKGGLKLLAIARIPEILISGQAGGLEPLNKLREDSFDGFYPFTHVLTVGGMKIKARLKVAHRAAAPNLVYNLDIYDGVLDAVENKEASKFPVAAPAFAVVDMGSKEASGAIFDQSSSVVNEDDGLNIEILQVWDEQGNELDPQTGEPIKSAEPTASELVDAAYQFVNATDAFKVRVAESIEETDYSEFASAKAMDMKAKELGAEIHWGMGAALDAVQAEEGDDDDFDPGAEFDACPVVDSDDGETLDGDFKGHPFRGNQHKKASAHSHSAVRASMSAKYAEKDGDTKGAKSAHKSAHYSHMAAAEGTSGKARKYHRKMAKFHGSRAGMTLDSVTFDDAEDFAGGSIVGKIMQGGALKGRAVIGGDGKAMVFVGKSNDKRVVSTATGITAVWGEDERMIEWLLGPAVPKLTKKEAQELAAAQERAAAKANAIAIAQQIDAIARAGLKLPEGISYKFDIERETSWKHGGPSDQISFYLDDKKEIGDVSKFHAEARISLDRIGVILWADHGGRYAEQKREKLIPDNHLKADSYEDLANQIVQALNGAIEKHLELSKAAEDDAEVDTEDQNEQAEFNRLVNGLSDENLRQIASKFVFRSDSLNRPELIKELIENSYSIGQRLATLKSMADPDGGPIRTDRRRGDAPQAKFGWKILDDGGMSKTVPGYASIQSAKIAINKNPEWKAANPEVVPFQYQDSGIGDKVVTRYVIVAKDQPNTPEPTVTPEPAPEPVKTDTNAKDRAFFMSLIDGTYPDLDDPELVNNLEAAYQRNSEDAEMVSLFTQAINAYTTASLAETEGM